MAVNLFEFKVAIRGYYYYKKYWIPAENQELDCLHEVDNFYSYSAIKTCESAIGKIVGHLLMGISCPTKFLLQWGAVIKTKFSSTIYRKSPLVQGVLEIPYEVSVSVPATLKNKQITEKFKYMVDVLYDEPDDCAVLG